MSGTVHTGGESLQGGLGDVQTYGTIKVTKLGLEFFLIPFTFLFFSLLLSFELRVRV